MACAAVSNLLYDFDVRTTYAFVHPMNKLQIGARLRAVDASELEVVRFKRNKDGLLEAGSNRPVSASEWAALLQGVGHSEFQSMFTLGWEELVQGTAELVARGGVLGETLFASGLGVRELGSVLEYLDGEAAKLYSPRGSARTVNAALKSHADARKRASDLSVRPTQYADALKNHEKAVAHRTELALNRLELDREHERLITFRGVLPKLRERTQKLNERSELLDAGFVPSATWAERVQTALESRGELTRHRSEADREVETAKVKLAEIQVDEALLEVSARVDLLAEGIAGYVQGNSDRGGLDEGRRDAEREALGILRALSGGSPGVAELEEARVVLAAKEAFGPTRDEWTQKDTALARAHEAMTTAESEIADIKEALAQLPEAVDVGPLRDAVDATVRQGDLDGVLAGARIALGRGNTARVSRWQVGSASLKRKSRRQSLVPRRATRTLRRFSGRSTRRPRTLGHRTRVGAPTLNARLRSLESSTPSRLRETCRVRRISQISGESATTRGCSSKRRGSNTAQ